MRIKLNEAQIADLTAIAALGEEKLNRIEVFFRDSPDIVHEADALLKAASTIVDQQDAAVLVRQLLALSRFARRSHTESSQVTSALMDSLLDVGREDVANQFKLIAQLVENLIACKAVRLTASSIELMYDYGKLIQATRILTDIRPIFSENGEEIEGCVVSHTLRIEYDSREGMHELSLALDEQDLKVLAIQCERALKKSVASENTMRTAGIKAVVVGRTDQGD